MKFLYALAVEIQPKALESEGDIGSSDFSIDFKKARLFECQHSGTHHFKTRV